MNFKTALIASTAISAVVGLSAATAEAQQKPELKFYGYYDIYAGVGDGDREGTATNGTPAFTGGEEGTFGIVHIGEIRLAVSGQTTQGMKWGVYHEYTMNDADREDGARKRPTDEVNLWMSGSWGKVEIGGQDGASDRTYRGATKLPHISVATNSQFAATVGGPSNNRSFAREHMNIQDTSDNTKITYFTPRINGFQAGYSWTPNIGAAGSIDNADGEHSAHEVGVEYRGKVGDGNLRATWGATMQNGRNPSGTPTAEEDNFGWRAGVTYAMGPWTVAAGYKDAGEWSRFGEDGDHTGWDIGAAWEGGPYEVALVHMRTQAEDAQGDTEYAHTSLTGGYNLGGGLSTTASLAMYDLDDDQTGRTDTDGWVGIVGIGARF